MAYSGAAPWCSRTAFADSGYSSGDVNNDGQINATDCSLILESYSSTSRGFNSPLAGGMKLAADVNKDGRIDSVDASLVTAYYTSGRNSGMDDFLASCYSSMQTVTYGEYGGFTFSEIEASAVRPEITLSINKGSAGVVVSPEESAGKKLTCTVNISGAARKYCSAGIHLYYDARLGLDKDDLRTFGQFGNAANGLRCWSESDYSAPKNGMKSIFLSTAGGDDSGTDGELFTFSFKIPSGCAPGTVFPFDIKYEDGDLFVNNACDREGCLMQAYTFTKGIKNWLNPLYIPESDTARCIALNYMDRGYDGYAAIADSGVSITTTIPRATTAPATTTTSTAKAPVVFSEADIKDSQYFDKGLVPEDSPVKPELSITVDGTEKGKVFDAADIAGKTLKCSLRVSGAEGKYSASGLHVRFDKRLSIVPASNGAPATYGDAVSELNNRCIADAENGSMKGIFFSSFAEENAGRDGTMWEFTLKVPENARSGDVYPFDIVYVASEDAEDMFFDSSFGKNGKLMNAYTFMYGIYNQRYNCNFKPSAADAEDCSALGRLAGYYDGYIAIAGDAPAVSGDTNLDGNVSIADAVAILQYIGNKDKYPLSDTAKANADVSGNGDGITPNDALTIQKVDAGLIKASDLPLSG